MFWNQTGAGNPLVWFDPLLETPGSTRKHEENGNLVSVDFPRVGFRATGSDPTNQMSYGASAKYVDPATLLQVQMSVFAAYSGAIWGIDAFHMTVVHEMQHYDDLRYYLDHGGLDPDHDYIIEEGDLNLNGKVLPSEGETDPLLFSSWGFTSDSGSNDREFRAFWAEVSIASHDYGHYNSDDWSKGGKQW